MSLEAGRKLAHYEIVEPIGKGGMGEVYRALDSKLGREVAIKVLPEEFSLDAERLARFKREAKVLASLNHPNIAAIHGLEESEGTHYLVLELVPGETLAERIAHGPIPREEAIEIAIKVAAGLEEAHEQGIVHRDLKPANIKLTPDDRVKILDFGLAKAFIEEAPEADDSMSPTITRDATRVGVILGTAAYMSPEQAKGKQVDRRTDIFAFGAVLYEMLTAKKAFPGEGVSETLAAVMKDEPDWSVLPADTPASLRKVLHRCLAKPAAKRTRHIGDVLLELEEPEAGGEVVRTVPDRTKALLVAATLVAIVAIGVAAWALLRAEAPEPTLAGRWRISLPTETSLRGPPNGRTAPVVAISPDGLHMAYIAGRDGDTQLYLKPADALDATPVEGSENASMPFFSANGRVLGFVSPSGTLMRVSLDGGAPVAVAEVGIWARGASWSLDKNITFSTNSGGVYRVPAMGGEAEPLALPDLSSGVKALRFPDVLPGSQAVLVTVVDLDDDSYDEAAIAALWPETGDVRILIDGGTHARYSSSGHLVYARGGALYAARFDASRVEVTGDPVEVVEGVATHPTMGHAEFDLSRDGSLLYAAGEPQNTQSRVVWVDRRGHATTLVDERRAYAEARISPDGRFMAVSTDGVNMSLWRYDMAQGTLTRMVSGGNNAMPVWTPDGERLTFMSDRYGPQNILSIAAEGSSGARMLLDGDQDQAPLSWAPDGRMLLFRQRDATTGWDLWLLMEGKKLVPALATRANESLGEIAPDGRWVAYQSSESGRPEIYICTIPDAEWKQRVSIDGGTEPRWNPNGRELFYRNGNKMMAVEVQSGSDLKLSQPQLLFESEAFAEGSYDVSADGERFVMIDVSVAPQPPTELVLVQNWAEELKRLVPTTH